MINTKIILSEKWQKITNEKNYEVFYTGYPILRKDGSPLTQNLLVEMLENERNDYNNLFHKLAGSYSIVIKSENIIIISDAVRSTPVFFGINNKLLTLSDSVDKLAYENKNLEINQSALHDFKMAGFCVGNETLFENIYQCLPGSALELSIKENESILIKHHNFKYESNSITPDLNHLVQCLDKIFNRFINLDINRNVTYAIPLSGGYDSRVIALMFKRLGLKNVVCYTYGKYSSEEVKISRYVARKLGYRWEYIPYSEDVWSKFKDSDLYRNSLSSLGNYCSVPHVQDLPAIEKLVSRLSVSPKQLVFVPGISADLNTGAFVSKFPQIYKNNKFSEMCLYKHIKKYSFNLISSHYFNKGFSGNKINLFINSNTYLKYNYKIFEKWISNEKVVKYVANSVRGYEHYGARWWLPFWDLDFIEFWDNVPLDIKVDQALYKDLIDFLSLGNNLSFKGRTDFRDSDLLFSTNFNKSRMNFISKHIDLKKKVKPYIPSFLLNRVRLSKFIRSDMRWHFMFSKSFINSMRKYKPLNVVAYVAHDLLIRNKFIK